MAMVDDPGFKCTDGLGYTSPPMTVNEYASFILRGQLTAVFICDHPQEMYAQSR